MKEQSKKSGILKGTAWVGSSRLIIRLLGLCSTFILARLLVPEDFGLVAIVTSIVGLLVAFSELGFNQALISFKDVDDEDYATAWTMNFCRGIILSFLLVALSYPLSVMLNDSRLFPLFLVVSCLPLISGLENPKLIAFEKKMQFDVIFRVMVFTKLVGVISTIALVFVWRSYWVLVVGMLITAATRSLLSYYFAPLKIKFTVRSWKKLFSFSGWIVGAQMLRATSQRLDPIILASFATPHVVGVLHIARELSNMTFVEIAAPVRRVLFPALSQYKPYSDEFLDAYKQSISGLFMILAPVCVGFVLVAPDAIPVLLGDQWGETILPIQIILSCLTFSILTQNSLSAAMAVGRPRLLFTQSLIVSPLKLLVYCVGVANFGLYGAIFAICFEFLLASCVDLFISKKVTNINILDHFRMVRRSIFSLFVMGAFVMATSHMLGIGEMGITEHFVRLIVLIVVGGVTYSFSSFLTWHLVGRPFGAESTLIDYMSKIFVLTKLFSFSNGATRF